MKGRSKSSLTSAKVQSLRKFTAGISFGFSIRRPRASSQPDKIDMVYQSGARRSARIPGAQCFSPTPTNRCRLSRDDGASLHYDPCRPGRSAWCSFMVSAWMPPCGMHSGRYLRSITGSFATTCAATAVRVCPPGPYSHVDDLLALIDSFSARPVHLVGLSLGGRVALRVAALHPEAVRSLTLADPALDGHAWTADWLQRWRNIADAAKRGELAASQETLAGTHFVRAGEQGPRGCPCPATDDRSIFGLALAPSRPRHGSVAGHRRAPAEHLNSNLGSGRRARPAGLSEHCAALALELPRAELRSIAGSGHMSNMEAPQEFNERVLGFLRRF